MENKLQYYNWFQKVMSVILDVFFYIVPLNALYVFTSFLSGFMKYAAFAILIAIYVTVIYFLKDKIREIFCKAISSIGKLDTKTMLLIITITAIVLKVIFSIFYNYDATVSGDIKIYNDIAEGIIESGDYHSREISHLYGVALHFVLFKLIGLPLHIGLFIAIYVGIVVNFYSFCRIVGKDKAFLAVMFYLLMPSTSFFTFCPTHEVFVFLYISIFLYSYNKMLGEKRKPVVFVDALIALLSTVLTCFVNPGGYVIYVIMAITAVLSNVHLSKKALIVVVLVASILSSQMLSKFLNVNEWKTTMNTYTILIHGVNPYTLGEQEDGYPHKQMRMYIYDNTLDFSKAGYVDAAKHVLINHYIYLLKNPVTLLKLVVHKIFILWSGVHYPIELANHYDAVSGLPYLFFLSINTLIYLFVFTVGLVYYKKREDDIFISNYKLEVLGVIALTLLCIVVNKYSVYVTLFIYLIAFYRADLKNEQS